jgi:hypothetical protein
MQVSYVDASDDKDFLESDEEDWEKEEEEEEEESESDEEFMSKPKGKSKGAKDAKDDAEKPPGATTTTGTNPPSATANSNMNHTGAHANMSSTGHMAAHTNAGHMNAGSSGASAGNYGLPPGQNWSAQSNYPNSVNSPYLAGASSMSDPRMNNMQAAKAVSYTAQLPALQLPNSHSQGQLQSMQYYYVNGVQYMAGAGSEMVPASMRTNNGV